MRVRGEYQDFLESHGDGCFTRAEIEIIERNLRDIPGPIPTVEGWFSDRNSLACWIAQVKKQWAEIDGPLKETRRARTDFRTQMKARWTPLGSEDRDQGLDKAIDRVFFFIIQHMYELDPTAINLEKGKRGHREPNAAMATTELLRQCLMAEGFAINDKPSVSRRRLKYARPDQQQIYSSLAVLDDNIRLPKVKKLYCRTGKQHIDDWRAMRSCATFEGVELSRLQRGTFNAVRVQLFRYWLFFYAGGHAPIENRSPQAVKTRIQVHSPQVEAIIEKDHSLEVTSAALRAAGSPLSPCRSVSDYSHSDSYETVAAGSDSPSNDALEFRAPPGTGYSPATGWQDRESGEDRNHQRPAISHVERLEMAARGLVTGGWQQDEHQRETSEHFDTATTSESEPSTFEAWQAALRSPVSLQSPRTHRPEERRQGRFFKDSGPVPTPPSPTPRPLQGQVPPEHIEFAWRGRVYQSAAPQLDQVREVMHMLRKSQLWVCDGTGRFLDPQYCLSSGISSFNLERKRV